MPSVSARVVVGYHGSRNAATTKYKAQVEAGWVGYAWAQDKAHIPIGVLFHNAG